MKIYEVSKLCNKQKMACLMEKGSEQWTGIPSAIYCLHGFPTLNTEQLLRVLDVPQNEIGSFAFGAIPCRNIFENVTIEKELKPLMCKYAAISGFFALCDGKDTIFIPESYFKPIGGVDKAYRFVFMESGNEDDGFVAVYDGLLLVAAFARYKLLNNEILDEFGEFADRLALAFALQEKRQSAQKEKPQSEDQMSIEED